MTAILFWAAWCGDGFAVLGSFFMSGGKYRRGWWMYLCADFLLIGTQIYHHIWSQVALFITFILLSLRGLSKTK